jgi:hypothetical protein
MMMMMMMMMMMIIIIIITRSGHLKTPTWKTLYKKVTWIKIPPHRGLPHAITYRETEGFAVAIRDRVIKTINYEQHCLGVLSDRHMHKI